MQAFTFRHNFSRLTSTAASVALVLCALFTQVACEGTTDGPGEPETSTDAGEPESDVVDADQYCEETADAFCAFYVRCGRMNVETVEDCRSLFLESCNAKYERRYGDLVDAGLLELSADGIAACDAHLREVGCEEQVLDLDGPCQQMWRGSVPEGGACGLDIETFVCDEDTACVLGLNFCGTCQRVAAIGENCEGDPTCAATATCEDGVCVERSRPGESCANGERCVLGAVCDQGVCRGPAYTTAGASCDQFRRCPYGTSCTGGRCVVEARHGEGCGIAGCATGYCNADGICTPPQEDGAACADGSQCAGGICLDGICEGLPSACIAP